MLYRENPANTFTPWTGQELPNPDPYELPEGEDDPGPSLVKWPTSIEVDWSADDLARWGLYAPVEPAAPAGMRVVGRSVERTPEGVVTYVLQTEPITVERSAIDIERERRIALPLPIELPSGQSFTINMDTLAQRNIQGVASVGMFRKSIGSTEATIFMDFDNVPRALTPDDMIVMGLLVSQRISTVYGYNFALKAMDPIPLDYADDGYWGGA